MHKRYSVLLFVAILCSAFALAATTEDFGANMQVRTASTWNTTTIQSFLVNQDPDPAQPGGTVELRFKVENKGYEKEEGVMFEYMQAYPFSLQPGDNGIRKLGDVEARQVGENAYVITYKLLIDKDATEGSHDVIIRYTTNNGKVWQRLEPFTVNIRTSDAILAVRDVTTNPARIKSGEQATITLNLENTADTTLTNIRVKLQLYEKALTTAGFTTLEKPFTPMDSSNEQTIKNLGPKESTQVTFNIVADPDAVSKPYKLPIEISYTDRLGDLFIKNITVGLVVYDEPYLAVNLDSTEIYLPNTKGKVNVRISNIGPSDVKFVTATLLPSDDYVILSPEFLYLGNIDSDDYETAEYEVYLKSTAAQVPLLIALEYRDSLNAVTAEKKSVPLKTYTKTEASLYGLQEGGNAQSLLIAVTFASVLLAFWLYMLVDCIRNPMPGYRKALWLLLFFLSNIIGAVLYYFLARKKQPK